MNKFPNGDNPDEESAQYWPESFFTDENLASCMNDFRHGRQQNNTRILPRIGSIFV